MNALIVIIPIQVIDFTNHITGMEGVGLRGSFISAKQQCEINILSILQGVGTIGNKLLVKTKIAIIVEKRGNTLSLCIQFRHIKFHADRQKTVQAIE